MGPFLLWENLQVPVKDVFSYPFDVQVNFYRYFKLH